MKYCAVKDGVVKSGDLFSDIARQVFDVSIDLDTGTLYIDGVADNITYSLDLCVDAIMNFINQRLFALLPRHGWKLYREL